jgi:hypothetical protein
MLDMTGREYYVSGVGSDDRNGRESIARGNVSFTVRVYGRHALGIEQVASRRDAHYANVPDRHQTVGTVSLAYNFFGDTSSATRGSAPSNGAPAAPTAAEPA